MASNPSVVGPVARPGLSDRELVVVNRMFRDQSRELIRQLESGNLHPAHVQALIEHRNPFPEQGHIIDSSRPPVVKFRKGLILKAHVPLGRIVWDPRTIELIRPRSFTPEKEIRATYISGRKLLNATVMEYLLDQQHIIPQSWKDSYVLFMGTEFTLDGDTVIPFMNYDYQDEAWVPNYKHADVSYNDREPIAALLN